MAKILIFARPNSCIIVSYPFFERTETLYGDRAGYAINLLIRLVLGLIGFVTVMIIRVVIYFIYIFVPKGAVFSAIKSNLA